MCQQPVVSSFRPYDALCAAGATVDICHGTCDPYMFHLSAWTYLPSRRPPLPPPPPPLPQPLAVVAGTRQGEGLASCSDLSPTSRVMRVGGDGTSNITLHATRHAARHASFFAGGVAATPIASRVRSRRPWAICLQLECRQFTHFTRLNAATFTRHPPHQRCAVLKAPDITVARMLITHIA